MGVLGKNRLRKLKKDPQNKKDLEVEKTGKQQTKSELRCPGRGKRASRGREKNRRRPGCRSESYYRRAYPATLRVLPLLCECPADCLLSSSCVPDHPPDHIAAAECKQGSLIGLPLWQMLQEIVVCRPLVCTKHWTPICNINVRCSCDI